MKDRFARRLANLSALFTSNAMTAEQITLAVNNLSLLIDRVEDVRLVVFPLWQREALAVAHSKSAFTAKSEQIEKLASLHNRFLEQLS